MDWPLFRVFPTNARVRFFMCTGCLADDSWPQGKTLALGPTMFATLVLFVEGAVVAKMEIPVVVMATSLVLHTKTSFVRLPPCPHAYEKRLKHFQFNGSTNICLLGPHLR